MTQTLTTGQLQEIYEAAVHSEATGDDQDAHFELLCKLEDVGGTGATIRKMIDMVRTANREAQQVVVDIERIERHVLHAVACPPYSRVVLFSSLQRLFTAPAVASGENCWSCGKFFTYAQHSECDGYCPHCDAPVDLDEGKEGTAPPAPAVPEEVSSAIRHLKDTLVACNRFNYCADAVNRVEDACRAAMLNHSGDANEKAETKCECSSLDYCENCLRGMMAQPVSQGYKLVPVEPTEDMIAAAMNCDDVEFNSDETFCVNFDNIYRAMLAAAPEGGNDA